LSKPRTFPVRAPSGARAAILFVHGGYGSAKSWERFPDLVAADPRIAGWDIYHVEYPGHVVSLYPSWWRDEPAVPDLAGWLATELSKPEFERYSALAFVVHSLGGLIVQRMMVDHDEIARRVSCFVQFGVSSLGFNTLFLHRLLPQLRGIGPKSPFIRDLRQRWDIKFTPEPSEFRFLTVAGIDDGWVPKKSSLDPFAASCRRRIPGDHFGIVRARTADHAGVVLVTQLLATGSAQAGPLDSASTAIQVQAFRDTIRRLSRNVSALDPQALVELALAYDGVGRRADAVALFEGPHRPSLDAQGTFAGRLKRRWWVDNTAIDGERALVLYRDGWKRAARGRDWRQAYYHAINVAFLEFAYRKDSGAAKRLARRALDYCGRSAGAESSEWPDVDELIWRDATMGEACIYLDRFEEALEAYTRALGRGPKPWQALSMHEQAVRLAQCKRNRELEVALDRLFLGSGEE